MAAPETSFEQYFFSFPPGTIGSIKCKTIVEKLVEVCPWLVIDTVATDTSSEYDVYLKIVNNKPYGMGVRVHTRSSNYNGEIVSSYKSNSGHWEQTPDRQVSSETYFFQTQPSAQDYYRLDLSKIGSSYCNFIIFSVQHNNSLSYRCIRFTDANDETFAVTTPNGLTSISSASHPSATDTGDIFNPVAGIPEHIANPINKMAAGDSGFDTYRLYPLITDYLTAYRAYYDVKFDGAKLYILQKGSSNVALPSGTKYRVNGVEYTAIDGLCIVPLEVA